MTHGTRQNPRGLAHRHTAALDAEPSANRVAGLRRSGDVTREPVSALDQKRSEWLRAHTGIAAATGAAEYHGGCAVVTP